MLIKYVKAHYFGHTGHKKRISAPVFRPNATEKQGAEMRYILL